MSNPLISVTSPNRAALETIENKWRIITGTDISDFVYNTDKLRLSATLVNGTSSYSMQLKSINPNTQQPYEDLLDEQDAFVAMAFRVGVVKRTGNTFTTPLFTYADPDTFANATEKQELEGLWQGANLTLTTNSNTIRLNSNWVEGSHYTPNRIQTAATDPPETTPGAELKGFSWFEPFQFLAGADNNTFQLTWGPYGLTAIATGTNTVLLDIFGVRVTNGNQAFVNGRSARKAVTC